MIAIISSILIVISSLVITLITSNPNFHAIMENSFSRTARANAYLYTWEVGQLNVRSGNLYYVSNANKQTQIVLSDQALSEKNGSTTQKIEANVKLVPTTATATVPKYSRLEITVEKK